MEVILTQDVEQIGKAGQKINARDGFARNYLFPNKLAVPATAGGLKFLDAKKKLAEEKRNKEKDAALSLAERIKNFTCNIKVKVGQEGKLFGSVTRHDIEAELKKNGFDIEKKKIELMDAIHVVGEYQVPLRLNSEVVAPLKVVVTGEA